ncbi:hypothetical protein VNO78_11154 [Psophocarpus tetragonolobus]|uniref:Uncharacterized protein n=1 Tax=Psophocarpus tetragonolobus TaxID=3891 RepID=A0AAN9XN63_PSOTE
MKSILERGWVPLPILPNPTPTYFIIFSRLSFFDQRKVKEIKGFNLITHLKDMTKQVRDIQKYCGELAPALLVTPQKCSLPRFPTLEPIIEEASDYGFQIMPKRMLFLVPAFISFLTYFFLYSNAVST